MKFKVEQIAICVPNKRIGAKKLLNKIGASEEWHSDIVLAQGRVGRVCSVDNSWNVAKLDFNYDFLPGIEFEILEYVEGRNWMEDEELPAISHFGMHVTEEELLDWKTFFEKNEIPVVQEVHTLSHTNPAIVGKRNYHYCIFNTRQTLGFDLKFIVRKDNPV
jgi:hypothetical protein